MCPPRIIAKDSLESAQEFVSTRRAMVAEARTENRGTRKKCDRLLASIDYITAHKTLIQVTRPPTRYSRVKLLLRRIRAHSHDSVLALKPNIDAFRQVLRHKSRHPNAQVDMESIL